jgi:CDP-2,3-bis-(O-geranylgeranyl)-sn-glycerol synthase
MLSLVINALWLMLPAYVPNSSAVLLSGKTPVDFGRYFIDGRRIFGPGKTFRGIIGGTLSGIAVGLLLQLIKGSTHLVMSFFKRRLGLARGSPLPVADQLDFVVGAWVLTYIFFSDWFVQNFTPSIIVIILILSPLLHFVVNLIGYKLGKKKEPW